MKLLFITPTLPNRTDKDGMTQVAYRLLAELTKRHAVTVWSVADQGETESNLHHLGVRATRLFPVRRRSLSSYYLFGSRVPYYQTRHESRALHTALQTLPEGAFDLVILHSPFVAHYVEDIHPTPVVIHAIDTLSTWFEKTAEHEWRPWKAVHLRLEARRARWSESHHYRQAQAVTFVGPNDEATVRALLPRSVPTATIPIGIDGKEFYPAETPPSTTTLVFSGMMNYPPNVDAAIWFAREVWPALRSRFPEARFRVVGKNPTPEVRALERIPGIEVTGMVPSVSAELRAATIAVSPLRYGTGFKIKAIEALACGAPLIASSETIQGYDLSVGTDVVVADDAESWVVACTDLLRNQQRRSALRAHGLLTAQKYSWGTIAARYEALYDIACHGS